MSLTSGSEPEFGKTGLRLSSVVFGSTVLGNLFTAPSDETKRALVESWLQFGGLPLCIDTAGKYGAGLALEVLGRELDRLDLNPEDVVISNKLAWRRVPLVGKEPTFEPGVWKKIHHDAVQDISRDGILRCHEDGCRLLGRYRPALVAVHDPDEYLAAARDETERSQRLEHILEAYEALSELRDRGDVAGVGVGSKDWKVIQELSGLVDLDWAMFANSFTLMHHPPELVSFLEDLSSQKVGIINSAVTHGGFLVGGEFCDYQKIDSSNPRDQQRLEFRQKLNQVCEKHGVSVFDACVAFGSSHPAIQSQALSSSRPERTESMVRAARFQLADEFWAELRALGLIRKDYSHV